MLKFRFIWLVIEKCFVFLHRINQPIQYNIMRIKITSSILNKDLIVDAKLIGTNTYLLENACIIKYSSIMPMYADHNVFMVEIVFNSIRVYIRTLNMSGKWSKNVVLSTDLKAVVL